MKVSVCLSLFLWLPLRMFPLRLMLPIALCTVFCPESQFSLGYSGFRRPKGTFPKPNISHLQGPRVYMLKHLDLTKLPAGSCWISQSQHNTLMHPHMLTCKLSCVHFKCYGLSDSNFPNDVKWGDRDVPQKNKWVVCNWTIVTLLGNVYMKGIRISVS